MLKPKVDQNSTGQSEAKESQVASMDTVRWIEVSPEAYPPIASSDATSEMGDMTPVTKEIYNIALLLPLRLDDDYDITDLSLNNEKFASFYAGLKSAAESSYTDLEIRITTYETNRDQARLRDIVNSWRLSQPDVIIGPYETAGLRMLATYAKENRIAMISPWRASTSVTSDNLYYLQIRPNVSAYYDAILRDMQAKYDRNRIAVIKNSDGSHDNIVNYIQTANQDKSDLPLSQPLKEIVLSRDTLLQTDSSVFNSAWAQGVDVFMMPQFNTAKDEDFVYGCLRKLNAEKANRDVVVYLMPLALNNDRIDLSILKNLNLRFCEYRFPDKRNPQLQAFKETYFNQYGRLPNSDSYFGYDFMTFVIRGLEEHGQYFHYYMKDQTLDLSQMSVRIQPYYNADDELLYLMNQSFYFIEFDDNRFVPRSRD